MISQKSKEIIDACRFCWMCRHICPVGNATGQERNTSRARALSLSLVMRDAEKLENVIDNVYECALCGACTADCATGWDPVKFTKEARLQAVLEGITPEYIGKLIDDLPQNTNQLPEILSGTLFFASPKAESAIKLMKTIQPDVTILQSAPESGYALDFLVGAAEETRQAAIACAEILNKFKTVVVYTPNDAKMFLREYKEWGIEITANIVTFTAFLAERLPNVQKGSLTYCFQDPAALARDLEETAPARQLLGARGNVAEMLLHGKETVLAGHAIMDRYIPDVMDAMAKRRWANVPYGAVLVTADCGEYEILKRNQPDDREVRTIEDVVLGGL